MTTLREALAAATTLLAQNEQLRDTAARDAEYLLLNTAGLARATLIAHPDRELTTDQESSFWQSIHRRKANEPIQYITGTQEFYGLDFQVTPAVLIPRPETELLVESVLRILPQDQPLRIADVGTGSGIIAIAMAVHLPHAEVTALDLSPAAIAIARRNAETHQVADRITFLHSDLLAAVAGQTFDAILSNPPYVPSSDLPTLHPQVRDHEPHAALFAGPTGLDLYVRLIPQAYAALIPDGLLALEIGYGQSRPILELLGQWQDLSLLLDLQGTPRTVLARKPSTS